MISVISDATITKLGLGDKPGQIFNADETGIGKKESVNTEKVIGVVGKPSHIREVFFSVLFNCTV